MVHTCCVIGCSNRRGKKEGVSFYRIPAVIRSQGPEWQQLSSERRSSWIAAIRRADWMPNKLTRVCSEHFVSGKPAQLHDRANPDWKPHLSMGYTTSRERIPDEARYQRQIARRARATSVQSTEALADETTTQEGTNQEVEFPLVCETPIAVDVSCQASVSVIEESCQTLDESPTNPKGPDPVPTLICSENLQKNPVMLKFYTGIPDWSVFKSLYDLAACDINVSSKLSKFDMFMVSS